jgi:hypothetical protein
MSCDNCLKDLCTSIVCDNETTLNLREVSHVAGQFTLVLKYQGLALTFNKSFALNEILQFDLTNINENYCYEGYLLSPDGSAFIFTDDTQSYSGIKFCTIQNRQV